MIEGFSPLVRSLDEIARDVPKVEGIEFGLPHLDKLTGGLRPNKLNFVVGYSHHGKTHMMLRALIHNMETTPCLFISGDDTDDILLCKIIAMREGISTEDVEAAGPDWRAEYVAVNLQKKLVIAAARDDYLTTDLDTIYQTATTILSDFNGEMTEPKLVGFDYVSILRTRASNSDGGGFNDVGAKIHAIKGLVRIHSGAVWLVGHQCRKDAADASALTLNHLEYGGHQQADGVIIGCRRKNLAILEMDELREEEARPKVYVSVMKNKITGRKSSNPAGYPFLIDPVSGYIREETHEDRNPEGSRAKVTFGV